MQCIMEAEPSGFMQILSLGSRVDHFVNYNHIILPTFSKILDTMTKHARSGHAGQQHPFGSYLPNVIACLLHAPK